MGCEQVFVKRPADPQALAERALELASGSEGCVVVADETAGTHVRFARSALTANGVAHARRLTVVCVEGSSAGVASSAGTFDDAALREQVERARRAAQGAGGEHALPLVSGPAAADWDEDPAGIEPAGLTRLAAELGARLRRATLVSGYAEQRVTTTYLASSSGLRLRHEQPSAVLDLVATRPDGSASSWAGAGGASIADVDPSALLARLERRLGWAARAADLRPGNHAVLLSPACVADLMLHLYGAATASEAIAGQGPFARIEIGTRLTAAALTLRSDPREPGLRCAPFAVARASDDRASVVDNGLPLTPATWIEAGALAALVHTRRTAGATGSAPTAAIDNLVLESDAGALSLDEMIERTDRALLVNALWYLRDVDRQRLLLTGLTRDGVYLVEHGEVVAAVPDFRFNESPVDLIARVTEAGRTEPALPREWAHHSARVAMPPLRVARFDVSAVGARGD